MSRSNVEDSYLLSPMQEGMLFHTLDAPDSGVYVVQLSCVLEGLDEERFLDAWRRLVDRHPILRSGFVWKNVPRPLQVVGRRVGLPVERLDWRDLSPERREERFREYLEEDRRRGFPPSRAPLMRLALVRTGDDRWRFLWSHHHILLDGWSGPILLREVVDTYAALGEGREPDLPPVRPFRDFITWLSRKDRGGAEAFWRRTLGHLAEPGLLPPGPGEATGRRYRRHLLRLEGEAVESLRDLARRRSLTLNTVVQAAWGRVLARWCGRPEAVFGISVSGRPQDLPGAEGMVGLFINTLPMRVEEDPALPLVDWLRGVQRRQVEALEHGHVSLADIQGWSGLAPGTPLFDTLFAFENYPVDEDLARRLGGGSTLRISDVRSEEQQSYPLAVVVRLAGAALNVRFEYDAERFHDTQVRRLGEHLGRTLEALPGAEGGVVGDLPLASAAENHQWIQEWGARRNHGDPLPVHRAFAARAASRPHAVAVVADGQQVSYGQLERRANHLAHRLLAHGVAPGDRVGVALERSVDLVTALLAVLKTGAAYVPLDPDYPADRLRFLVEDGLRSTAGPLLLTSSRSAEAFAGTPVRRLLVEELAAEEATPGAVPVEVSGDHVAYVIYTSGSTGRPKGVPVTHRNVSRLFSAGDERFDFGPGDVWTLFHSFAFDFSVWELWGALAYGGRLVVVPFWVSRSPGEFHQLLVREGVTVLNQTPSAFQGLVRADGESAVAGGGLPLRWVIFGGEALEPASLAPWFERHGDDRPRLVNMYGITETTVHVTWRRLRRGDLETSRRSPVGRALSDLSVHVLDRLGRVQPVGVAGELVVGGPGLAHGYLGRPALTARRFVPDPFGDEPGGRLYRSGDLARTRSDGELDYLGRIDQQVKLRGFRIELGEIQAALVSHPAVAEATVLVHGDEPMDQRLVAWLVPSGGCTAPARDELRRYLADWLPEPMIPAAFVVLESLPLTAHGKLDRRALPAPRFRSAGQRRRDSSPVEEVLCGIWAEVLGVDRVAVDDDFFELGGHSILGTRIVARIARHLDVQVELRDLFAHPTVAALASRIEERRGEAVDDGPPLEPVPREEPLPLSFSQERLWFLDRLEPGSAAYNVPMALRLRGNLRSVALEQAVDEIRRRQEALRSRFPEHQGRPVLEVLPPRREGVPRVDLGRLPVAAAEQELARQARSVARRPFDLARGPLLRLVLVRLGEQDHGLLATLHHSISDAWSLDLLVDELSTLYRRFGYGEPSPLEELPVQYGDYAAWQRRWLSGERLERQLSFWRRQLAGLPPFLDLPTDRPRPVVQRFQGASLPVRLSTLQSSRLVDFARRRGATPFMVLLAAFSAVLGRLSGCADLAVGSPVAGRRRWETENVIGFFVNTLVLRCDLGGGPTFLEAVDRIRRTVLAAHAHEELPFERLVEELHPQRDLGRTPLFQVLFAMQSTGRRSLRLPELEVGSLGSDTGTAQFDLSLSFTEGEEGFRGSLEFRTDLFDATTCQRLLGCLAVLLDSALEEPRRRLDLLPMLTPGQRTQLLVEWNDPPARSGLPPLLHGSFEASAARSPGALALVAGGETWSYGRLEGEANRLAWLLRRRGVEPDVVVALLLDRRPELAVAILATLKAGGAWMPLDPQQPDERLREMVRDGAPALLLSVGGLEERARRLAEGAAAGVRRPDVLLLDRPGDAGGEAGDAPPPCRATSDHLAAVIYTSASTGKPKGVLVTHRNLATFVEAVSPHLGLGPGDRALQLAPLGFDVVVEELFPAWAAGAAVVLPAGDWVEPDRLAAVMEEQGVTFAELPVPYWNEWCDHLQVRGVAPPAGLRKVLLGCEQPTAERLEGWSRFGVSTHLVFGLTETAVTTTLAHLPPGGPVPTSPDLGRPVAGSSVHVLDRALEPVPPGCSGEMAIGGEAVARGYLGRAAETAERFVPDPFAGRPGARMYRTGDRAAWRADGRLRFLGRIDHQLKIRGVRVEPAEVEAVLQDHPAVEEAVVTQIQSADGERRLAAYLVTAAGSAAPSDAALRDHAADFLPPAMVPAHAVVLERLPRTAHGKIDRGSLPVPPRPTGAPAGGGDPDRPVRSVLTALFEDLLGVEVASAEEDFFSLGGHSLLATRLVSRIRDALGVELPVRSIFERPTVAGLAELVEAGAASDVPPAPPLGPRPEGEAPILSFAQERLWFLDQLEPGSPLYNVPAALRLVHRDGAPAIREGCLGAALGEVVRRHRVLRTLYPTRDGRPAPRVESPRPFPVPVVDLGRLAAGDREAELRRLAQEQARRPFDLAVGPLLRTSVLRLEGGERALLFNVHHLVSDGGSAVLLLREIQTLYAAFRDGRPSPLAEPPLQYDDFAHWQRRWLLEEGALEALLDHWRGRLRPLPPDLDLPTDRPRPTRQRFRGAQAGGRLEAAATAELRWLGRHCAATPFMVLLAAFLVVLRQRTGQDDLVVGTNVAGRRRSEVEGLVGLFLNQLVLRTDLSGDPSFPDLVRRVREVGLDAYSHQDLPFDRLVEDLRPRRQSGRQPLFQVKVDFENQAAPRLDLPDVRVEAVPFSSGIAHADLTLHLQETAEGEMGATLVYDRDLYDPVTAEALVADLFSVCRQVAGEPDCSVSELVHHLDRVSRERSGAAEERMKRTRAEKLSALGRGRGVSIPADS